MLCCCCFVLNGLTNGFAAVCASVACDAFAVVVGVGAAVVVGCCCAGVGGTAVIFSMDAGDIKADGVDNVSVVEVDDVCDVIFVS